MLMVKAKAKDDWNVWIYGVFEAPDRICTDGHSVEIIPRTLCENTGIMCNGQYIYENDWLEMDECGDIHKFLVARGEKGFRAYEDESVSYDLRETAMHGRIVGNLYG